MNLDDLMDKIRQVLMVKWNQRRKVAMKLEGSILPHIIQKLNERSRDLDMDVLECSSEVGEVSVLSGSGFRCVVKGRTCTCRKWQVCGIPCIHAIVSVGKQARNTTGFLGLKLPKRVHKGEAYMTISCTSKTQPESCTS
jgi:hypothetical protein